MTRLIQGALKSSEFPRESLADNAVPQHQPVEPRGVGGAQCVGQTAHDGFTLRVETALAAELVKGLGAPGAQAHLLRRLADRELLLYGTAGAKRGLALA